MICTWPEFPSNCSQYSLATTCHQLCSATRHTGVLAVELIHGQCLLPTKVNTCRGLYALCVEAKHGQNLPPLVVNTWQLMCTVCVCVCVCVDVPDKSCALCVFIYLSSPMYSLSSYILPVFVHSVCYCTFPVLSTLCVHVHGQSLCNVCSIIYPVLSSLYVLDLASPVHCVCSCTYPVLHTQNLWSYLLSPVH